MNWFRNRCARFRESLCLLATHSLPEPETQAIERHLAECAGCRKYFHEMQSVVAPLADWEEIVVDVEPRVVARERWARAVAAATARRSMREFPPPGFAARLWIELIRPLRRTWAGLATAWVALAIFNYAQNDARQAGPADTAIRGTEARLVLEEQYRVLTEMLGPSQPTPPAQAPRRPVHLPRSERRSWLRIV